MNTDALARSIASLPARRVAKFSTCLLLGLSMGTFSACGDTPGGPPVNPPPPTDIEWPNPGGIPYGEECEDDDACETLFCTTFSQNSPDAFCSVRCSEDADCPQTAEQASQCIFVTREGRLSQVCAPSDLCIDRDGDGFGSGPGCEASDCDDTNPNVHPGAPEICDGLDNNCDDQIDIATVDTGLPCKTDFPGVCAEGLLACSSGALDCRPLIAPGVRREICDGLDNDCDGFTDEAPAADGWDRNVISEIGEPCGEDASSCFSGLYECSPETTGGVPQLRCVGDIRPPDDRDDATCNYVDDNCNGEIDEDYRASHPTLGTPCQAGIGACKVNGRMDCDPTNSLAPPVCSARPNMDNAQEEVCNGYDDNCNGEEDEPFKNNAGVYNHIEHCGACNIDCNKHYSKAENIVRTCSVTGAIATCDFTCVAGWVDFNNSPDDGCEYKEDADAIHVVSIDRGGEDTATCGSSEYPCASVTHGIQRATTSSKKRVRVSEGTFAGGFTLSASIDVLGGHSSATWEQNPDVYLTALRGGNVEGKTAYAVRFQNITTGSAEFSGFNIEAPDSNVASGNSVGIWIINSTNALKVRNNTVLAGRGGAGTAGTGGNTGAQGAPGSQGRDRINDASSCTVELPGGAGGTNSCGGVDVSGGAGASSNCPSATSTAINSDNGRAKPGKGPANVGGYGTAGESPMHYTPAPAQHGVYACEIDTSQPVPSPTPGITGANGTDGARGNGATSAKGTVANHVWTGGAGANGTGGANGAGGGGGGSSGGVTQGGIYHYGATGGGGGAGGCAAGGGNGGQAGGGSFGIFLSGTGSSLPLLENNAVSRGNGGRGGQGGIGGVGGDGGAAGLAGEFSVTDKWSRCGQHAADGGVGGRGGHGGGGGGGAGGIAYDFAISGYSVTTIPASNVSTVPANIQTGGAAGLGGGGIINPGSAGVGGTSGRLITF